MSVRAFEGRPYRGRTTPKVHAVNPEVPNDILGSATSLCGKVSSTPVYRRPLKDVTCTRCIAALRKQGRRL